MKSVKVTPVVLALYWMAIGEQQDDEEECTLALEALLNEEDRENVLRARASGKGVLTAPFPLLKTGRLGVILTFAVYKKDLPWSSTPDERIQAADGLCFRHQLLFLKMVMGMNF